MINYQWIGSLSEKNYHMIWGLVLIKSLGFDSVDNSPYNKYMMFSGRSNKRLTMKMFNDTENNVTELVKRKIDKGYSILRLTEFLELVPDFESTIDNSQ